MSSEETVIIEMQYGREWIRYSKGPILIMADLAHDICMYNNHPRDTVCIWTEYYVHTSSAYTYTNDPGMYDMNQVPVGVIT